MYKYRFTEHANFRNGQRVGLHAETVISELESGRYMPIGYEIGNGNKRMLFLNPRTSGFYVAVFDE